MNEPHILIVDDEPQMLKLLRITLQSNGYEISEATDAKQALALVANHPPALIILDLGLPDEDGHSVLKKLREWYSSPVIILSVRNSEEDIVTALDNGANDYLVKPFRGGELLARVRSALRSFPGEDHGKVFSGGGLEMDFTLRTVKKEGKSVKLTATEYSLLLLLVQNEGRVLTHHYLLRHVWGPGYMEQSQYLRVFIAQLRKKIEDDPNRPKLILTESGVGYRFTVKE